MNTTVTRGSNDVMQASGTLAKTCRETSMRRHLLLAATLGALAIAAKPAAAHGPAPTHANVGSSFGLSIIVRDGPKVVHHHHQPGRHLRAQPWRHHFSHHAPTWRWHKTRHHGPRHFQQRDRDHRPWFRAPGPQQFKRDHAERWSKAPWHDGRRAFGQHFPDAKFKHGRAGSDRRRHR
jgi:hypothetical protein